MSLTPGQVAALRELDEVWPDTQAVIIGAAALGFYYDMHWRRTADVDLVVALELGAFPGALLDREGWKRHPRKEHEFTSPQGVRLDLLPAGEQLVADGRINWPSGHVMSLAGMDLAFEHAEMHEVAGDYSALVAPPKVVTILKMVSYSDRPAERQLARRGRRAAGSLRELQRILQVGTLGRARARDPGPRRRAEVRRAAELHRDPRRLVVATRPVRSL